MLEKATRPTVKPPNKANNDDKRKLELIQLETRYKSTFRLIKETSNETVVRLAIKPSDPDFPYEIEALQLQLNIPKDYPKSACTVQVLNNDIPKGFAINLEKGYSARVDPSNAHQTLVRQMNWLDRNMETLLQQAPAPTVRFISNLNTNSAAVSTTDDEIPQHVKPIAEASILKPQVNTPVNNQASSSSSSSKPIVNYQPASTPRPSPAVVATAAPAAPVVKKETPKETPKETFSPAQIASAEKRRRYEYRQIQTRFCDTFKTVRTNAKETVATLVLEINDTDFTHEQLVGGKELYIKYHVPALYPLQPCSIEIENRNLDKTRANWISEGFKEHVANGDYTLFENLNWLNRNLESLVSTPPTSKTAEEEETEIIAASQQKDLKPPTKQQQQLSVTAPVFTPKQQPKKTSLFDENDDIKKNKVIIVNDPSLIIEQADEEEVEVELAKEDDPAHTISQTTTAEGEGSSSNALSGISQPVVRKGTEIRLVDPKLENVSLFRCSLLHIMVKCHRCKDTCEVENIRPDSTEETQQKKERWMACPTCTSLMGIKFLGELVHQGALSLGLLQLSGCSPFDILPSAYIGTCGSCMMDMTSTLRLSPHDPPRTFHCHSCHAKMTCGLGSFDFVKIGSDGGEKLRVDPEQVMKLKKKKKREDHLKIGEPLPDSGTCSHYRKSKRWFRFSCCNKLYPCDVCHDSQEDHHVEMAKRHVCGMCSREQTITPGKPCTCGHEFDKAPQKGAFWEGGKGVRNKNTMSRKDPHKHKGLGKSVSKKQERVGLAGKERHQQQQNNSD